MKQTIIKPKSKFHLLDISEIIEYRELFVSLVKRDLTIRYKQTVIGISWALLQPTITMLIFTIFFGTVADIKTGGIPYPIFSFAGLLLWNFFSSSITNASSSLVNNSNLITKIYFPRIFIPVSTISTSLVDYSLSFLILIPLFLIYKVELLPSILLIPLILASTLLLTLGTSLWLSALNVKYRDIKYIVPFFIQILLFATPVIYPLAVATNLKYILYLNPLTGLIEAHRGLILGGTIDPLAILSSLIITFVILITGLIYFRKTEKLFADII